MRKYYKLKIDKDAKYNIKIDPKRLWSISMGA